MSNWNLMFKALQNIKIIIIISLITLFIFMFSCFISLLNKHLVLKNEKKQTEIMQIIQKDLKIFIRDLEIEQSFNFHGEFIVPFKGDKLIINEAKKCE